MAMASVQTDIAPLYEQPGASSLLTDEALYGMSVQAMEERGSWSYVRTAHGTAGYTPTSCLNTNVDVAVAWGKYPKITVLAPYVDVQSAATDNAPVLASLPRGGLLVALGKPGFGGWQKVGLCSGGTGYTRSSYMGEVIADWTQLTEADMRWNIVESALAYTGAAYRAGGRTVLGIDSVGLAAMAYLLNGVVIPRFPFFKQGSALHSIALEDMDEGDVIFFRESVGIYMGEDKFVHATTAEGGEGVVVSSLRHKDENYRPDLAEHIVGVGSIF